MTAIEIAEDTKIIIGVIGGILSLLGTIMGLLKWYYVSKAHCKSKPSKVEVKPETVGDKKFVSISWADPARSCFPRLTCKIKSYSIRCCLQDCDLAYDDLQVESNSSLTIELVDVNRYNKHTLQVTVNYVGRLFSTKHSSESSDVNEENCHIFGPPSEPKIIGICQKNEAMLIKFQSPQGHVDEIKEYRLKYVTTDAEMGDVEEELTITQYETFYDHLETELKPPLSPDTKYSFSLAAVSCRNQELSRGKWSGIESFVSPSFGCTDQAWSYKDWQILKKGVIDVISSSDILTLNMKLIGSNNHQIDSCEDSRLKTKKILEQWKLENKDNANILKLIKILKDVNLANMADKLEDELNENT